MHDIAIFNNITFREVEGCDYKYNYVKIARDLKAYGEPTLVKTLRDLVRSDLFFLVYFVLGVPTANFPFVVSVCREVEEGPQDNVLDIWPRWHFKSTILTIAQTVQYHLIYPDRGTCIFSFTKTAADAFLQSIRLTYETVFLKFLFPDILFKNPSKESTSWSLKNGISLKRKTSATRKNQTVEATGLVSGMRQGSHYERLEYDDIETDDMKDSQEQLDKCLEKFKMSLNLRGGTPYDTKRIRGTFYSHTGPLVRLLAEQYSDGTPIYTYRHKTLTKDGTPDGEPVMITREKAIEIRAELGEDVFFSQMMCDPTPRFAMQLDPELLIEIPNDQLPDKLYKFMIIDPAGSISKRRTDRDFWAIHIIGVNREMDALGASDLYILDTYIDQANESEIVFILHNMYWRNALIDQVSYERLGGITPGWMVHFVNGLQKRGVILSEDTQNLVPVRSKNQNKKQRITASLKLPLLNGKIHYLDSLNMKYMDHLKKEMSLHPAWHDDGIDALSYIYQAMEEYGYRWRVNWADQHIPMSIMPSNSFRGGSDSWMGY
jgi:hypothetical protein